MLNRVYNEKISSQLDELKDQLNILKNHEKNNELIVLNRISYYFHAHQFEIFTFLAKTLMESYLLFFMENKKYILYFRIENISSY